MEHLYLIHHGILGQKWGVRRYQNEDGTLTDAGRKRLSSEERKTNFKVGVAEKRLNNRIKDYDKITTKAQYSLSENKRNKSLNSSLKKDLAIKTLKEKENLKTIGDVTIKQREISTIGAGLISAGSAFAAYALESSIPIIGIPAATITAGAVWYKSYH